MRILAASAGRAKARSGGKGYAAEWRGMTRRRRGRMWGGRMRRAHRRQGLTSCPGAESETGGRRSGAGGMNRRMSRRGRRDRHAHEPRGYKGTHRVHRHDGRRVVRALAARRAAPYPRVCGGSGSAMPPERGRHSPAPQQTQLAATSYQCIERGLTNRGVCGIIRMRTDVRCDAARGMCGISIADDAQRLA